VENLPPVSMTLAANALSRSVKVGTNCEGMHRQTLKKNLRIDGKKKFALVSADPAVIHPLY
jgi:hypothetical protein